MAVVPNAAPLDRALDEAARVVTAVTSVEVQHVASVIRVWVRVFEAALDAGDERVAEIALREYGHARAAFDALIRPPP